MTGLRSSCGACKFLRRKCNEVCVFAPYFCHEQGAGHFAAVHKVFGASNVSKLLTHLPPHNRTDAAVTITYEALARMQDPIYGCVGHIFELQLQVATLQEEIELLETQVSQSSTTVVQVDGTCQTILDNTSGGGVPFSLQPDHMDIYEYNCDGEAALAPSISKEEMAGLANNIDDNMGLQQIPSTCTWGESSMPLDSVNGLKTSQAGEMEIQEIFTQELSWLDDTVYLSSLLASFNS